MRNIRISIERIIFAILVPVIPVAAQEAPYAPNRIIVKFKETVDPVISRDNGQFILFNLPAVDELNARYGCTAARKLVPVTIDPELAKIYILRFKGNPNIPALLEEYRNTGYFLYAEPDYQVKALDGKALSAIPNDPYFYRQWSLQNDGVFIYMQAKIGADIDMNPAWDIETGDSNTIVGIIDTGCKLDHPEFAGRIWTNAGEIPGNGIDDDNNGYIDDVNGWNFAYGNNDPSDDVGHGTAVTSIIGATGNNGMGYAGINWYCKLMISKACDSTGYYYMSGLVEAIIYSVDHGADVLNMSLGGFGGGQALKNAINYALSHNVTCVAAMGNQNNNIPLYPAVYPGVIAVGSTNSDDQRSVPFCLGGEPGSNFGSHISVVAPGNMIFVLDFRHDFEYYNAWCGTSFATPHVVGVASLLLAQDPALTPEQIKSIIENSAEDQVGDPYEDIPGWDPYYGYGRLNAYQALITKSALGIPVTKVEPVKIYPNPSTGVFTVIASGIPPGISTEIVITDILGRLKYGGGLSSQKERIDLSLVPEGIYNVAIRNASVQWNGRLIVAR